MKSDLEKVLEWVYDNHNHHAYADQKLPKNHEGCYERDYPYVNSIELVEFIKSISNKNGKRTRKSNPRE